MSGSNTYEKLASEVATVKNTMKVLSDQWEKWNTLFITSLEPRITSTASTLSSIDSNIHNLQERAHVWDTFQLHVSAWNDQLASFDRKMDILSKGMEQLMVIDNKLKTMHSESFKLDTLLKMVNSLSGSVLNIKQFCNGKGDTLVEEFAVRGILGSLKLIERKIDKLLITKQGYDVKPVLMDENKMKCNMAKATEDLLNDISSKVDIIFDSVYKKIETDYNEEYLDSKDTEGSGSTDVPANLKRLRSVKRGPSLSPYSNACCRSTERGIEDLNKKITNIDWELKNLRKSYSPQGNSVSTGNNVCYKKDIEEILRNFTQSFSVDQSINNNLILESYFDEQRAHLSSVLESFGKQSCLNRNAVDWLPSVPVENEVTPTAPTLGGISIADVQYGMKTKALSDDFDFNKLNASQSPTTVNKSSCDELDYDSPSGTYVFRNSFGEFLLERFFNKQYCEVRDDGFWTVIQRRDNYSFQHDFNVSWYDYKLGFGDLNKDFWIGNNYLARLSNIYNLTLRIELGDFDGSQVWAEYEKFSIDTEKNKFKLTVGGYTGNASDAFSNHNGALFSTYDRKNDDAPECCPCSVSYGGGWWFTRCFESNLNGIYYRKPYENDYFRGIIWEHWLGNYSLKKSRMMIKSTGLVQFYTPNITRIEDP